jgi:hypothetical protein
MSSTAIGLFPLFDVFFYRNQFKTARECPTGTFALDIANCKAAHIGRFDNQSKRLLQYNDPEIM